MNSHLGSGVPWEDTGLGRNIRSVWTAEDPEFLAELANEFPEIRARVLERYARNGDGTIWRLATQQYRGPHFATFPEKLAARCILAGCPVGGIVLDPFAGSGTTGVAAERLGRTYVLCDLKYQNLAAARLKR